jgi:hypothetical protein
VTAIPDPSGHHDDLDDGNGIADGQLFVVPDDASALDADRDAYYRELADLELAGAADGLAAPDQAPPGGRSRRFEVRGLSAPLVTAVLLVVAMVGSLMTVLAPRNAPAPAARPLATSTVQPAGAVGGLLPDVTLSVGPVQVLARSMRPTVFLLVPADCADCAAVVSAVLLQVRSHRLQLVLAGSPAEQGQLADLDRKGAAGQATLAIDPSGQLGAAYGDGTPTVVVVAADGIVTAVEPGVTPTLELDPDLFNALRAV